MVATAICHYLQQHVPQILRQPLEIAEDCLPVILSAITRGHEVDYLTCNIGGVRRNQKVGRIVRGGKP
jgi:hypothetical protein